MDKLVRPVFTIELNYKLVPGLVTIGKYDGTHPCLTAATTADKIIIHSPHRRQNNAISGRVVWSESNKEIATLNINQSITAIAAGNLVPNDDKDILIIGTATHLLVYHVHDNKDIFYRECTDSVKAIAIGLAFDNSNKPLVMVGGNSSVHGYDHTGTEIFWVAIGDVVTALILMDYNKDGTNELIVSSEDFHIRVYKSDRLVAEHVETEVVTGLTSLGGSRFAYAVSNGTVGVYEQDVRLWRVKSKHFAIAMQQYDLLALGSAQLITGWSNGKIDCRSIITGKVLFKDTMVGGGGIAGVVEGDYRSIGKSDVICVSSDGEVRGYTTTKSYQNTLTTGESTHSSNLDHQNTIRELLERKQALLMELKHYENNTKFNENVINHTESYENSGVIPANTRLQIGITTDDVGSSISSSRRAINDHQKVNVNIYVSTNNDTIIKAVIIFAEGIFNGETHVVHPSLSKLSSNINVPLFLPKDIPVDIHIKALVGYPSSIQFHVFEITRQLPRFAMYSMVTMQSGQKRQSADYNSISYVEFKISERLQRICMWINQNFLLSSDVTVDDGGGLPTTLRLHLKCLRTNKDLLMVFEAAGKVQFFTDDMHLAADLVQSLATFLKLDILDSTSSFMEDEKTLRQLMEKLVEIQNAQVRLGTDVADRMEHIRYLVIKAEDSRINDIKEMPGYYNELNNLNNELINGYNIRLQSYNEGLETIKQINSIIQKASRLRVGKKSSNIINNCRKAIINNNIDSMVKIIRTGET